MKAPTSLLWNLKEKCCPRQSNVQNTGSCLGSSAHGPWVGLPLALSMAWMVVNFTHANAYVWAFAHVVPGPSLKVRMWRHPASKAEPIMLSVDGWDPQNSHLLFHVLEVYILRKTAVGVQANWDWSQLFLLDAKSQMYTHSSLPLPSQES